MTASCRIPTLLASAASLLFALPMLSQQPQSSIQPRIAAPINGSARAILAGSQPPRARVATDEGAVEGSTPLSSITMYFSRSAQQQSDLDALIAAQQNPSSPQYHQWLTPAQFGARFSLADADIAKVQSWLESQGFSVESVAPSRNSITFSGTASLVASAFAAPLHHYRLNGENHIAPSADLSLPSQLASIVSDVRGLSDFRPHPHVRYGNGAAFKPNFTSSQTGNHYLTPGDVAVIYDIKSAYNAGYNGNGQTIAIMGQSAVLTTDITNFQTAIGQTSKAPTILLVPNTGASEAYSGDESESDLDLEYATGIAPGATIDFVYVGADETASVFDSLTYAITNRVAPILNISYGECEATLGQSMYNTLNATLQQAAAQGQSIISAAGDDGSTDCYGDTNDVTTEESLAVDFPSSSQYVTAMGGTEFPLADVTSTNSTYFTAASGSDVIVSALSYIPEQAWNDDSASYPSDPLSSGGGGESMFTPAPSWQTGVPGIPAGVTFRLVPDISLDASPNDAPYAYCSSDTSGWASGQESSCSSGLRDSASQDLTVAGGTSFAAPVFSGMVAIINQARGYTYQGLVNPTLYTLASNATTYASAFHDITTGSNACDIGSNYCSTAGAGSFSTGVGYDEATGLGSVDLNNLINAWPASSSAPSNPPYFNLSATSVTVTSGSSTSSTVTITPANGYTGTINWSVAPSTIPAACYSISPTTVTGTAAMTATISIQTGSTTCASGFSPLGRSGTGTSAALRKPASPHRSPAAPMLAGLGLIASIAFFGRRRNRVPVLLAVVLLAGFGVGLSGCGGATAATGTTGGGGGGTGGGGTTGPVTTNYAVTIIGTDSATSTIKAQATFNVALTTTS